MHPPLSAPLVHYRPTLDTFCVESVGQTNDVAGYVRRFRRFRRFRRLTGACPAISEQSP